MASGCLLCPIILRVRSPNSSTPLLPYYTILCYDKKKDAIAFFFILISIRGSCSKDPGSTRDPCSKYLY